MCTASWLTLSDGYELFFNRDESRRRLPARAPEPRRVGGLACLAPIDGDAGGTWLAVNELGLSVAVLNAWEDRRTTELPRVSRGELVLRLAACRSQAAVADHLAATDLRAYRGFRLAVFEPGVEPRVFSWGAEGLVREDTRLPLCSSSLGAERAFSVRSEVLSSLAPAGTLDAQTLEAFQKSHEPERGPWSPCMHRADASTVSASHVAVGPREITFRYAPGPPCRTPWQPALSLERNRTLPAAR